MKNRKRQYTVDITRFYSHRERIHIDAGSEKEAEHLAIQKSKASPILVEELQFNDTEIEAIHKRK